jgi:tRNA pseudouridine55 synthase
MTPNEAAGVLLLNKSPGFTSFESLNPVKKALATRKAGHTGTLDKFASGLLVVLAGWALKLSPWFDRCDKRYRGTIRFGVETDTLDGEGRPVATAEPPGREALEEALEQFRGDIMQAPPAYSAIHINGRRAYELARSGAAPEMHKRPVTIYELELCSYAPPLAELELRCSKGVYVRSLARDLALAAGSRGFLQALTRTAVAGFRLSEAPELPPPAAGDPPGAAWEAALRSALRPVDAAALEALGIPRVLVDDAVAGRMLRGAPLGALIREGAFVPPERAPDEAGTCAAGLFRSRGAGRGADFLGIIEQKPGGPWSYGYVYAGV